MPHMYIYTFTDTETGTFYLIALQAYSVPMPLFLCSLLFTSNGTSVTFHKVNGLPSQGNTQCSSKFDRVLAMAADPDSSRLFWVSLRYNRLILNWAIYNRETCNNRYAALHTCMYTYRIFICHCVEWGCVYAGVSVYMYMYA